MHEMGCDLSITDLEYLLTLLGTDKNGKLDLDELRSFMDDHHVALPPDLQQWFCENKADHRTLGPYPPNKLRSMAKSTSTSKKSLFWLASWTKQLAPMNWEAFKSEEWWHGRKKSVVEVVQAKKQFGSSRSHKKFPPLVGGTKQKRLRTSKREKKKKAGPKGLTKLWSTLTGRDSKHRWCWLKCNG
jgi:hypothetical protein